MKSVVICGSRRFKAEMWEFAKRLKELNVTVYEPHLHNPEDAWNKLPDDYKEFTALGLTHDHFYKIKMADALFIYNRNGYAGCSTTLEIGYGVALGKPIYALAKDQELCRHILFREIVCTPEELAKALGYPVNVQKQKKIVVCGSVMFRKEMVEVRDKLNEMGYQGVICSVMEDLALGRNPELLRSIEENHSQVKKEYGFIKWYYDSIVHSDAILVLNYDKNGINNYIGGNTLMEIAFAYVHDKKIFLLNSVPEISYRDEIIAMEPIVLNGDLSKIAF